jgi:aminoglycoside 3-N-acetyltransferase
MHLAEYRVAHPRHAASGAAVATAAGREWVTWEDVLADEEDFAAIGAAFDASGAVRLGPTGIGESRLMRQRELVAFGVVWMTEHRG